MGTDKAFEFKIEGGFLIITADPNKDGQNVMELKIDLLEVPDEIMSALKKDEPA
jgi:hypothetical protein